MKPRVFKINFRLVTIIFVIFWLPVILFTVIANEVSERKPLPGDVAILTVIHRDLSPHLSRFFLVFTDLGSTVGIITITGLLLAYCLYRHHRQEAKLLLAGVGGAAVANVVIKLIYKRQRPSLWHALVSEPGYSFPSGHAMASSALVFTLVYISWNTRLRWPVVILGIPFFLLVSLSRLYFGVHYPSDIVGGWLASLLWVSSVVFISTHKSAILNRLRPQKQLE